MNRKKRGDSDINIKNDSLDRYKEELEKIIENRKKIEQIMKEKFKVV